MVVRASVEGESRRAVVGGLLAGLAALSAAPAMAEPQRIPIFDDRKVNI